MRFLATEEKNQANAGPFLPLFCFNLIMPTYVWMKERVNINTSVKTKQIKQPPPAPIYGNSPILFIQVHLMRYIESTGGDKHKGKKKSLRCDLGLI